MNASERHVGVEFVRGKNGAYREYHPRIRFASFWGCLVSKMKIFGCQIGCLTNVGRVFRTLIKKLISELT